MSSGTSGSEIRFAPGRSVMSWLVTGVAWAGGPAPFLPAASRAPPVRKSGPSTGTEGLTLSSTAAAPAGPFFTKEAAVGDSGGYSPSSGTQVLAGGVAESELTRSADSDDGPDAAEVSG